MTDKVQNVSEVGLDIDEEDMLFHAFEQLVNTASMNQLSEMRQIILRRMYVLKKEEKKDGAK